MHGDDVDIAFHRDDGAGLVGGAAGLVEIVKHLALVKERGFRRVQVFCGHVLGQRPAAEGNDLAARIADGEHDPVAETVIGRCVVADDDEAGLRHLLHRDALARQMAAQRLAVVGGIAEAELLLDGRRKLAVGEIAPGPGAAGRLQLRLEELRRNFHDVVKACALFLASCISFRDLGHGKPGFHGKAFHRFGEAQALLLDQEGEDVARGLAAEAVIAALLVLHMEGGRLLAMEGAAGPVVALARIGLAPVPLHLAPDDRGDRDPGADVVKE